MIENIINIKYMSMPKYKQLQMNLIEARRKAGLTQLEAARKINRTQSYISKIENGKLRIDIVQLAELAEIYGISVSSLVNNI